MFINLKSVLICVTSVILVMICLDCASATGHGDGGHSNIFRKQESTKGHSHYAFGYDIKDPWGATNFRKEKGDFTKKDGWVEGVYGLKDKDGRARLVKYVADKNGFNAEIKTNEPGTSDADTAAATYNGADGNKGKWSYDVSVKDSGKSKGKDSWSAAASELKIFSIKPKQSEEYVQSPQSEDSESPADYYPAEYEARSSPPSSSLGPADDEYQYEPQTKQAQVKKLKLYLKPQYDYYYGSPAEESA
ncbi:uncharacterized protein LOC128389923 [Panonychus citri]|uniref:uncharacterized protein LOC128387394 n=1 Tax=Panonychus citri TaxID=50023 RepID=UPI002306EE4D|nr:uncharacterized protein LOC128387394 [Panonychus citri]XP_053205557.1 uncharacterized protein LOC128389923 [Panonychus citri]